MSERCAGKGAEGRQGEGRALSGPASFLALQTHMEEAAKRSAELMKRRAEAVKAQQKAYEEKMELISSRKMDMRAKQEEVCRRIVMGGVW